ncbi:hypothetical protein RRF57_004581 [Xylaria bambusicola]|uniref:Uncharacterized protein n=1 Tax=Xylaria bambusicola TaxID=326684 RepID=A0AAN7Z8S2_9PEZI
MALFLFALIALVAASVGSPSTTIQREPKLPLSLANNIRMTAGVSRNESDKVTVACQTLQSRGLKVITPTESSEYVEEQQTPW